MKFYITMKKIIIAVIVFIVFPLVLQAEHYSVSLAGRILLQVEKNGEAWYVYPLDVERYYLGRPIDAFNVMKKLSLGAKHDFIQSTDVFPDRLLGRILLDVEKNGEAYYINPVDKMKYYLDRPADAFRIMRELGLGISNTDIVNIPIGDLDKQENSLLDLKKVLHDVPFTSQAPFGDWEDQRQQDGCEEASALMAVKWARGEDLGKQESLDEILAISDYILNKYGEYRDISLSDMKDWIFKDYLEYDNVWIKKEATILDIIEELNNGNLVISPMNGQIMHNPYFTQPGPPRHMIVIRGYDPEDRVFITNDPGTRHGEAYEYDVRILYNAIRDYPTGYHEYIENIEKDVLMVGQ